MQSILLTSLLPDQPGGSIKLPGEAGIKEAVEEMDVVVVEEMVVEVAEGVEATTTIPTNIQCA